MLLKLLFAFLVAVNGKIVIQQYPYGRLEFMEVNTNPCVEKCVVDNFRHDANLGNKGMHYMICSFRCDNPEKFLDRNEL